MAEQLRIGQALRRRIEGHAPGNGSEDTEGSSRCVPSALPPWDPVSCPSTPAALTPCASFLLVLLWVTTTNVRTYSKPDKFQPFRGPQV